LAKIGVISDIHSNLHALESVLERLEMCDSIICLGDIVGYGAFPNECIDLVREYTSRCIMGNHDAACVGILSLAWFNPYASAAARWTMEELNKPNLGFLRGLPSEAKESDAYMVHGTPREPITEYLTTAIQARSAFSARSERLILVGHTHVPFIFMERQDIDTFSPADGDAYSYVKRRIVYNPGAVGQPRDGDSRAAYAVIDTEERKITQYRVEYDVQAAREAILDAGLPRILADRLVVGR